ncbi:OPT oligopeptide transporter protein-domain-containing protein [Lipomyces japonicus]|uniref:OPT oligopeptide transporter protein-domain-containing protein n=1 Tax=Lipomyces japonicus TaxID=56871 RepID=UPI0034CF246A
MADEVEYTESEKNNNEISITASSAEEKDKIYRRIRESDDLKDLLNEDLDFLIEKFATIDVDTAIVVLTEAVDYHDDDVNFPTQTMNRIKQLLQYFSQPEDEPFKNEFFLLEDYQLDLRLAATLIKYHSPYPEVRAVCKPFDDPTIPVETFRAYLVGFFWVGCASFINEFFWLRQPKITLNSTVIQVLTYPTGKFVARILPRKTIRIFGREFTINHDMPWTFKEQMLVAIMANVGLGGTDFLNYATTMKLSMFFGLDYIGYGFVWLMNFSVQTFGIGVSGILRRWVVYPTKAVWPTALPTLQLNKTLLLPESKKPVHGWTVTRYQFFFWAFASTFLYYFIPDYLFTALSTFNWITWIAPKNKNLAFVTGSKLGMGYNPLPTFDWAVINYTLPLSVPFYTAANRYIGVLVSGLVIIGCFFSNYKFTGYVPINTSGVYDRYGKTYNISRVLTPDHTLDPAKYRAYSPPYVSAGNLVYMGASYALMTFSIVYVMWGEWPLLVEATRGLVKSLRAPSKSNYENHKDPISVMMSKYPEVPDWWFFVIFVISLVVGIIGLRCYPTGTPIWAIIIMVLVSLLLLIPIAVMYSVTGYMVGLQQMGVILGSYMVPGNAIANMMCRAYGFNIDDQADSFISDQKLGHYAKLPPRAVFRAQISATLIQVTTTTGALQFLFTAVPDLCSYTQAARFVCSFPHQLYSDTLLLGVVGPYRTFDVLYPILKWAFLIGVLAGVPVHYIRKELIKRYDFFQFVQPVVFLGGFVRWGSTYNLSYFTGGFYMSWIFMYYIRRRYLAWWTKFNYVLSSALTAGVAFSGILIFLALQYHPKKLKWWGNDVSSAGVDGKDVATLYSVDAEHPYFGLADGQWK